MTGTRHDCPTMLLYGSWKDDHGSTRRYFSGRVLESDRPDIRRGELVMIVYQCPEDRVVGPGVHGSYLLKTSRLRLPLISFLCEAIRHPGGGCREDTAPAQWAALAVSEAVTRGAHLA